MSTDPLDGESVIAESEGRTWNGLPEGTIMGHVHLHVAHLPETETFYNALGFEVVTTYPQALFMSNGKYHHHLGLNTWNGVGAPRPSAGSAGLQSFTLIYPKEAVLKEAIEKVEAFGAKVEDDLENLKLLQKILLVQPYYTSCRKLIISNNERAALSLEGFSVLHPKIV